MAPTPASRPSKKKGTTTTPHKSTPRSAVQVKRTLSQEMEERQERALDLEEQLQKCSVTAGDKAQQRSAKEATANRLRIPLCEVLADMMLTDPARSIELDVDNRLWRHCFYSRIVPQRTKIQKAKKRATAGSSDLIQLEQSLHTFLAEAVTLYQYMAQNLLDKLQGHEEYSQTQSQSQDSMTASPPPPLASTKGMVELLHRIYIRLGDLFRYTSTQLPKAQDSYTVAASLGPGHGHAYNQIAVVCQSTNVQQQQSAVALYWYARSLWATVEQFETSRSNVTRLFQDNAEWLSQQTTSSSTQPEVQQLTQSNNSNLGTSKPVLQTRQFLAEFVELHKYFFVRQDSTTLWKYMGQVMDKFSALLAVSAFGDALLVKLVCIQAFSEWNCRHAIGAGSSRSSNTTLFALAARTATYQLASRMADKVLSASLNNNNNNSKQQAAFSNKPSIRLWLPLLLVSEYMVSSDNTIATTEGAAQLRHEEARHAFWERMVQVWNHVQAQMQQDGGGGDVVAEMNNDDVDDTELFKDYKPLVGFAPFEAFLPVPNNNGSNGFVSDEEAIALLTHSKPAAATAAATSQDTKGQAQAAALARRMLRVALQVSETNPNMGRMDNGVWTWDTTSTPQQQSSSSQDMLQDDPEEEEDEPMLPPPVDDDHKEGNGNMGGEKTISEDPWMAAPQATPKEGVLMYQTSPRGGPALLVPGALLGSTGPTTTAPPVEMVEMDHILGLGPSPAARPAFVAPPPGIGPPPGFGGFAAAPAADGGFSAQDNPQSMLFSSGGGGTNGYSFMGGDAPATVHDVLSANRHSTLLNPPTQNPFATNLQDSVPHQQHHNQQPNPLSFLDFHHNNNNNDQHSTQNTSLLDSGLLGSLWMNDSTNNSNNNNNNTTTRNPFAF